MQEIPSNSVVLNNLNVSAAAINYFIFCYFYFNLAEPPKPDPCNPTPCGPNAVCNNGVCTCLAEYQGDPYRECRPECVQNYDCPKDKACLINKCIDPCPGTCGQNAECTVINHIPMCSCIRNYIGNAFISCNQAPGKIFTFSRKINAFSKINFRTTTKWSL